jgi:hypothetical protein
MKAGRELDAQVAEKVMGLQVVRNKKGGWSIGEPDYYDDAGISCLFNPLPEYSTDIAAAWKVVEHLMQTGHTLNLDCWVRSDIYVGPMFEATIGRAGIVQGVAGSNEAPLAICLAALKAVGQ